MMIVMEGGCKEGGEEMKERPFHHHNILTTMATEPGTAVSMLILFHGHS